MTFGSEEWIKKVTARIIAESEPLLQQIAEVAAKRYNIQSVQLRKEDAAMIAAYCAEIQDQSFLTGLQLSMKVAEEEARLAAKQ